MKRRDTIGLLAMFWTWALKASPDGEITNFPPRAIADATDWNHKPQTLIDALIKSKWVDKSDDGKLTIHDWDDYTWRFFDKVERNREQTKKRVTEYRKRKKAVLIKEESVTPVTQCNVPTVTDVTHEPLQVTQCNAPTVPNLTKPIYLSDNSSRSTPTVERVEKSDDDISKKLVNPDLAKVNTYYAENMGQVSLAISSEFKSYLDFFSPDVICAGIDEAVKSSHGPASFNFLRSILGRWKAAGINTLDKVAADRAQRKPQADYPKKPDISTPDAYEPQRKEKEPSWMK